MLYITVAVGSIITLIIHTVSFSWFEFNENSHFHNLISLWLKDPFEKLILVDENLDCPSDTSELVITYNYEGNSGLCDCQSTNSEIFGYNESQNNPQGVYLSCETISCPVQTFPQQKIDSIPAKTLTNFFQDDSQNSNSLKVCANRIAGYAFAKRGPLTKNCSSDQIYCDFNNLGDPGEFDVSQGYCIPSHLQCQTSGVRLQNYTSDVYNQLPIVDIIISNSTSELYNIPTYQIITEKSLLLLNHIQYPQQYSQLLISKFHIQIQHMPRVQFKCRASLEQNLTYYIGPDVAFNITLALVIISAISCAIESLNGYSEFKSDKCFDYHLFRVSSDKSLIKNLMFLLNPILLILQIFLNAVMIAGYTNTIDQIEQMITNNCLDTDVAQAISSNTYEKRFTLATLIYSCLQLLFDQQFYSFSKIIWMAIFNKFLHILRKQRTIISIKASSQQLGFKSQQKKEDPENELKLNNAYQISTINTNPSNPVISVSEEQIVLQEQVVHILPKSNTDSNRKEKKNKESKNDGLSNSLYEFKFKIEGDNNSVGFLKTNFKKTSIKTGDLDLKKLKQSSNYPTNLRDEEMNLNNNNIYRNHQQLMKKDSDEMTSIHSISDPHLPYEKDKEEDLKLDSYRTMQYQEKAPNTVVLPPEAPQPAEESGIFSNNTDQNQIH